MGLVEYHEVPRWRFEQPPDASRPLERVDAGDEPVVLRKSVRLAISNVTLTAKDLEVEAEHFVHFTMPVVHEASRHDHQRALQLSTAYELTQEKRRLDRLAKADLIGNEKATRRSRRDSMR